VANQNVVPLSQYLSSTSVKKVVSLAVPVTIAVETTVHSVPQAQKALDVLGSTTAFGLRLLENAPNDEVALQALQRLFQAAATLIAAA
jgi:hypothetical protein